MRSFAYRAVAAAIAVAGLASPPVQSAQPPAWVFQAPVSDSRLIAVGMGKTLAEARQSALANILLQVSQEVQVTTESRVQSRNGDGETLFRQQSRGESLALDVGQADILQQWQGPDSGDLYLQLAIAKDDLARALLDRLDRLAALNFPTKGSETDQLLWSLKFLESLDEGLRLERALAGLGQGQPRIRELLLRHRQASLAVWQSAGVRVIAKQALTSVAGVVSQRLPVSGKTVLWLQLDQQTHSRKVAGQTEVRQVLSFDLKQPAPPFTSYHRGELVVVGAGPDRNSAAQAAEQALYQKLNQSLASWLF